MSPIIKGKLNTLEMFAHREVSQIGSCVLCDFVTESFSHIFLECNYVIYFCDVIKHALQIQSSPKAMFRFMDQLEICSC